MNHRSFYTSPSAVEQYLALRWPVRIWRSVLEQAIDDIVKGPPAFELRGKSLQEMLAIKLAYREAAQHWVDDPVNEPRRFVWVCEQLGLEPAAVRREIESKSKQQGVKTP
jgi:hypothetical protein